MGAETMLWASDATWVHSMLSVKEQHRVGERPALFVSPRDDGACSGGVARGFGSTTVLEEFDLQIQRRF
jgi:hypothetical protein